MNHERKPADVAELARGVQQARLDVELVNDFQQVVVRHRFRWFAQGGEDHGLDHIGAHHAVKQLWRYVHHQVDLALLEEG